MRDGGVTQAIHMMNKGKVAFRLIVLRWKERQGALFREAYNYHCIATNMVEERDEEVVWRYNRRAQIENHIKELRGGFGREK